MSGEHYLELVLRLARLAPELVDAYARRWMLDPDPYVEKRVASLLEHPWPPYLCCYTEGLDLCREFAARESSGFRRLLTEPLTTADLVWPRTFG